VFFPDEMADDAIAAAMPKVNQLAMDHASRMARAKEMGFDTDTVYYHGTNKESLEKIADEGFRPDIYGGKGGSLLGSDGTYFTPSKQYAAKYGSRFHDYTKETLPKIGQMVGKDKKLVVPVYLKKDAITDNAFGGKEVYVDGDQSNIRSVNAAFDPAKSSSSNLLASGLAGTAIAGGLGSQEAEAGGFSKGMKKLYRGLESKYDPSHNLSATDAPEGYSTWTDNPELARQYAGKNGEVYEIDVPESELGIDLVDADGERPLFVNNRKAAGLNGVSGNEFLLYQDHDNFTPSMIKASKALAPAAVGLGALMGGEEAEASFLGQGAKYADKFMLDIAQKMGRSGIEPDEIWQKTGWGKGVDDKWRFEVSDENLTTTIAERQGKVKELENNLFKVMKEKGIDSPEFKEARELTQGLVEQTLDPIRNITNKPMASMVAHPELFNNYPPLQSISTRFDVNSSDVGEAAYNPTIDQIRASGNPDAIRSSVGHELQHAVQEIEGLAKGGRPKYEILETGPKTVQMYNDMLEVRGLLDEGVIPSEIRGVYKENGLYDESIESAIKRVTDGDWKDWNAEEFKGVINETKEKLTRDHYRDYQNLAGEVEARNVQTRQNMTPAERRAKAPWLTEDVPRSQQIVRYAAAPAVVGLGALYTPEQNKAYAYNPDRDSSQLSVGNYRPETYAQDNAKALRDLHNLEKGVEATYTAYGADAPQQPSHDPYNTDYGTIEPDEFPMLQQAADSIDKWTETPLGLAFEGITNYMRGFGDNADAKEKAKRAIFAALDLI
jgi:hypothetical protein